jgi:RimJ/RimL family protein N-acetyltransferase
MRTSPSSTGSSAPRRSRAGGTSPRRGRSPTIRLLVRHLIEDRGHHRITIDPAADNAQAIRAYEKAGFRPVGVMRAYERDMASAEWHDGLLMELVGAPPKAGGAP